MKKSDVVLKEYVSKLSFENLKYLFERFNNRMGSDLSEACSFLLSNPEIDKLLGTAQDGDEFFNIIDTIAVQIEKEFDKRIPDLQHN